jgi:hypothetical protein
MAAGRAAELTEAYRVLMDKAARAAYDEQVAQGRPPRTEPPVAGDQAPRPAPPTSPPAPSPEPPQPEPAGEWRGLQQERQSSEDFVRREALRRVRHAVSESIGSIETLGLDGFELSYACRTQRRLFKKGAPDLYLLVRYVQSVDAAVITELWPFAAQFAVRPEAAVCILLLGPTVAPRADLAAAITTQRRHARSRGPLVLVPIDVHDWEAHIPANTPPAVKTIIQRLREDR